VLQVMTETEFGDGEDLQRDYGAGASTVVEAVRSRAGVRGWISKRPWARAAAMRWKWERLARFRALRR
jgi:hypothetical protein